MKQTSNEHKKYNRTWLEDKQNWRRFQRIACIVKNCSAFTLTVFQGGPLLFVISKEIRVSHQAVIFSFGRKFFAVVDYHC